MFLRTCFLAIVCCLPFSEAVARDDDAAAKTVDAAILKILLARGIIDQETFDEIMALALVETAEQRELDLLEERFQRLSVPEVGTGGGRPGKLHFESEDGKWSLGFKGRLNIQAEAERGEGGNRAADENNISVRRGRLAFFGKAGGENTTYKIEIDAATQSSTNEGKKDLALTDAWVNWGVSENTDVKAGQFKFPFGREVHSSSTTLNLVEESMASKEFTPDREPGLMAYGHTEDKFLEWWAGLANGEGQGRGKQSGKTGSSSTGMRKGFRLVMNPLGEVKKGMSAFQTVNDGSTRVAFGGSYMVNDDQSRDVDGDGTVGDGSSDDVTQGYELQVVSGPFSFVGETFHRKMDLSQGAGSVRDDGFNAQLGMFLVPNEYELVLRHTQLDFDTDDDMHELTLGLNVFADGQASKWSFDLSRLDNKDSADSDSTRARALYQIIF
jgi:hypothetical protein